MSVRIVPSLLAADFAHLADEVARCEAGGAFAAMRLLRDQLAPVTVGSTAPPFTATTLDATPRPVTLADFKGRVVLLNIWATWCVPCRMEMPSLEQLHQAMDSAGIGRDFTILAVSIDNPGTRDKILAYQKSLGLTFDIVHDPTGDIGDVYQTAGVPESFLIGRDGVIRRRVIGAIDWNSGPSRALIAHLVGDGHGTAAAGGR
jgi:cytochrome c biogenesis protein CcmG, thiol:disulfide interchange protein DsbE